VLFVNLFTAVSTSDMCGDGDSGKTAVVLL